MPSPLERELLHLQLERVDDAYDTGSREEYQDALYQISQIVFEGSPELMTLSFQDLWTRCSNSGATANPSSASMTGTSMNILPSNLLSTNGTGDNLADNSGESMSMVGSTSNNGGLIGAGGMSAAGGADGPTVNSNPNDLLTPNNNQPQPATFPPAGAATDNAPPHGVGSVASVDGNAQTGGVAQVAGLNIGGEEGQVNLEIGGELVDGGQALDNAAINPAQAGSLLNPYVAQSASFSGAVPMDISDRAGPGIRLSSIQAAQASRVQPSGATQTKITLGTDQEDNEAVFTENFVGWIKEKKVVVMIPNEDNTSEWRERIAQYCGFEDDQMHKVWDLAFGRVKVGNDTLLNKQIFDKWIAFPVEVASAIVMNRREQGCIQIEAELDWDRYHVVHIDSFLPHESMEHYMQMKVTAGRTTSTIFSRNDRYFNQAESHFLYRLP